MASVRRERRRYRLPTPELMARKCPFRPRRDSFESIFSILLVRCGPAGTLARPPEGADVDVLVPSCWGILK